MCTEQEMISWRHRHAEFLATWFFSGVALGLPLAMVVCMITGKPQIMGRKIRVDTAAGTVGSAVAMAMIMSMYWTVLKLIVVNAGITFLAIRIIPDAVKIINWRLNAFGGESIGHDGRRRTFDHRRIVIDEVHGMFIAVLPIFMFDIAWWGSRNWTIFVAFLLFRLFDTTKWPLIKKVERYFDEATNVYVKALGVMIDDTIAGVYAALIIGFGHLFYIVWLPGWVA